MIIVKSLSKDFGIAGVRAGYAVMSEDKVKILLSNGYLWNVSGLADYFFKIYSQPDFVEEYNIVRKKYIMNTLMFLTELNALSSLKVYPSKANFALVELKDRTSFDFYLDLLVDSGVYVRDCSDKIGLEGEFVRIASRTFKVNLWGSQSDRKLWIRYKIWNNLPPYIRPFLYFFYRYILRFGFLDGFIFHFYHGFVYYLIIDSFYMELKKSGLKK